MPETSQLTFSYKEVATALVKAAGIHEGVWALYVRFGLSAANLGETPADVKPAAIIPLLELGIVKQEKENNIAVDAAKVNPKPLSKAVKQ